MNLVTIIIPCCICLIKINKSLNRFFLSFHLNAMVIIDFWNDRFLIFFVFLFIFLLVFGIFLFLLMFLYCITLCLLSCCFLLMTCICLIFLFCRWLSFCFLFCRCLSCRSFCRLGRIIFASVSLLICLFSCKCLIIYLICTYYRR